MNQPNEEEGSEYQKLEWILEALRLTESATAGELATTEIFAKRCAEAATLALNLTKLREERYRVGFVPLPATEYIQRLVEMVDIPDSPLFSYLSEEGASITTPRRAFAFGQVAQRIGMSLREALIHIRIGFSAHMGSSAVPILLARARSAGSTDSPIERCEALLREIESEYDISTLRQLRALELELSMSYDRAKDVA